MAGPRLSPLLLLMSPLGDDTLPFQEGTLHAVGLHATERISAPFEIEVAAVSTERSIDPNKLLCQPVCVTVRRKDGLDRCFHGVVRTMDAVGCFFHQDMLPVFPIPDQQTRQGFRSRSTPGGGTRDYSELSFDDKKGEELVFLRAQKDHTVEVENDQRSTIGHDRTVVTERNDTLTSRGGNIDITADAGSISITAATSITLRVGGSSIVLTPAAIAISAPGAVTVEAGGACGRSGRRRQAPDRSWPRAPAPAPARAGPPMPAVGRGGTVRAAGPVRGARPFRGRHQKQHGGGGLPPAAIRQWLAGPVPAPRGRRQHPPRRAVPHPRAGGRRACDLHRPEAAAGRLPAVPPFRPARELRAGGGGDPPLAVRRAGADRHPHPAAGAPAWRAGVGTIEDRTLLSGASMVLIAKADAPAETLRRVFFSTAKVGAVEHIRELVNVALPGIELRALPVAPRQMPFVPDAQYFELDRNSPHWQRMQNSGDFAIHVSGDFPNLQLELWAIRA